MNYRKQHKWFGIIFCFFLMMFAISGIVLNHRSMYGDVNVSRAWLPKSYRFKSWNNGLLRGSMSINEDSTLVFGAGGIFVTDDSGSTFTAWDDGMPRSADSRAIKNVARTADGTPFAVSQFDAYMADGGRWVRLPVGRYASKVTGTRFADVVAKGDTVVFVGRDQLYVSIPPYETFEPIRLQAPMNYTPKVSLFRVVWLIHNGQIFGIPGKVVLDLIGILFVFFCLSGISIWLLKKTVGKRVNEKAASSLKWNLRWHGRIGRYAFVVMLLISITGFALRPPLLLALAKTHVSPIPFTTLDSDNPWKDKLRALRWDEDRGDWLMSTSDGFYALDDLRGIPSPEASAPPVSVMGVNVMQKVDGTADEWLVGSFSGMYRWNRSTRQSVDYITGKPASKEASAPFGKVAVSGFSTDFGKDMICLYDKGTEFLGQPSWMEALPMSAWQLALEIHTGRLFCRWGNGAIYIFLAGLAAVWILLSGWMIMKRRKK